MLRMHSAAWYIFINSVRISCAVLAAAVLLFVISTDPDYSSVYSAAVALSELPPALLLLAVIVSVCVDDKLS